MSSPLVDDKGARLQRLLDEHRERHQRFQANHGEKTERLLARLLPDLEPSSFAALSNIGFGFAEDMLERVDRDRRRCETELRALDERLDGADGLGTEPSAEDVAKLESHFAALQPFLRRCFDHPRFEGLLLEGYGTDDYPKKFWHLSYHLDRRAAKEIEDLCEGRTFAAIRREAIQAMEASSVLKGRIESLKARKMLIADIGRQKTRLQDRLASHQQIWLASAWRQLRDAIEADPTGALEKCRTLAAAEAFEWRLAKELCKEHWGLKTRFLNAAEQAHTQGLRGTRDQSLDEYESMVEPMKRFDQPSAPKETIDWKAFIFQPEES